jgi:DNA (cytosine-5)-methyltransferase 1
MAKQHSSSYIDIFAGCGGLSLGLSNAGWRGLFAIEKSPMAFETLKHNLITKNGHFDWPAWLPVQNHDIYDVLRKHQDHLVTLNGKVDLVVGGPPCQGFSHAGRRNMNDKRNKLVKAYVRFIRLTQPRNLFFENVRGFASSFSSGQHTVNYADQVIRSLHRLGYDLHNELVDFSQFGVPQKRNRVIIFGSLDGDAHSFFEKLHTGSSSFLDGKGLGQTQAVQDALSDLQKKNGIIPSPESRGFANGIYSKAQSDYQRFIRKGYDGEYPDSHRFANHSSKVTARLAFLLANSPRNHATPRGMLRRFGLKKRSVTALDASLPSPTLTTLPDDYIHYSEPRILTPREYARLQSFPDWFELRGKYTTGGLARVLETPRYTQIGNAVPPLFSEHVGELAARF